MKKLLGTIMTLVIGGTVYTVSQADVAKNLSKDTGMTQQEAQQYVENVSEDDLVPYDKVGSELTSDGQSILSVASDLDCVNYDYEWETLSLTCEVGQSQLKKIGNNEIALGKAYTRLSSESASRDDISLVINLIDRVNADLNLGIVSIMLDYSSINETRKTNSYNKALLQAALDSN